jgi:hypothetical protein
VSLRTTFPRVVPCDVFQRTLSPRFSFFAIALLRASCRPTTIKSP